MIAVSDTEGKKASRTSFVNVSKVQLSPSAPKSSACVEMSTGRTCCWCKSYLRWLLLLIKPYEAAARYCSIVASPLHGCANVLMLAYSAIKQ